MARLDRLVELLLGGTNTTNLVSRPDHSRDFGRGTSPTSLQLLDLAPTARTWIDLGSGAGFPGLVIACALADQPGAKVHLVESNAKKAAFLREATRLTGAPAIVHAERIERFRATLSGAGRRRHRPRACAAEISCLIKALACGKAERSGLFPKGQDVEAELTEAAKYWNIKVNLAPSRTDSKGRIVVVRALERRK